MPRRNITLFERFFEKVKVLDDGCWEWTSNVMPNGYGTFSVDGRAVLAHRLVYELLRGELVKGLTIDHLCRNRKCVNPWHLELVTRGENVMRGESFAVKNALKTHCPKGHPYSSENTYLPKRGGRMCRECRRQAG